MGGPKTAEPYNELFKKSSVKKGCEDSGNKLTQDFHSESDCAKVLP